MNIRIVQENNKERGRFVAYDGDTIASIMSYVWSDKGEMLIDHTKTDASYSNKGIAKALLEQAVIYARNSKIKINPCCSFVKVMFDSHPEYKDVESEAEIKPFSCKC